MSPLKRCAVCGDKALGYNFNAVSCESCKAFFRRNALAKKEFTCPFNQNCDITVVTRRFCQKCRLKKCIDIGMKSENIMSEEDKLIKRRKIETNRAKRKQEETKSKTDKCAIKQEQQAAADSSGYDGGNDASYDSQSCGSFDSATGCPSSSGTVKAKVQTSNVATTESVIQSDIPLELNHEVMTSEQIVEYIVSDPDRASQAISKLMRSPAEALSTLEKIINSQKDALRLISHLIAYPGDALKIISKLMNSPLNALTVFTKFMSSPTDALEIISKIVDSPQDVLQFIKNLMDSPEDALDIMNKFMNTPVEALKMLNQIFNGSSSPNPNKEEDKELLSTVINTQDKCSSPDLTPEISCTPVEIEQPILSDQMNSSLIHSMLNSSPTSSQYSDGLLSLNSSSQPPSQATTPNMTNNFTLSPQSISIASPMSAVIGDVQFNSPTNIQQVDDLPSSSAVLLPSSPVNLTADDDFNGDCFDIKALIQNSFLDNSSGTGDGINSLESVLTEVIRIEYEVFNNFAPDPTIKLEPQSMLMMPQQSTSCNAKMRANSNQETIYSQPTMMSSRDLNETERMKLRELKMASEALYYPVDDDLSTLMGDDRMKPEDTQQDPKLLQVINLTAVAIKRLIKMAKKISAFHDMCQEDQVALLKGGCTEMMIMRSVMTYDNNRNTWKIPHTKENMSNIRAEVLKLAKGNLYEEHLQFIRTFDEKWRMDENIVLIICAIVLFTPTRPRVIHSDVIKLEQNSYYYLLRRYLESVYSGCEAKSAFIKLIQKISDVERLNQCIIGVYLNVNPSQVEPLLREIFDLKNH